VKLTLEKVDAASLFGVGLSISTVVEPVQQSVMDADSASVTVLEWVDTPQRPVPLYTPSSGAYC
jgi:hypothetical protein